MGEHLLGIKLCTLRMEKDGKYIKKTKYRRIQGISDITLCNEAVWGLVKEFSLRPFNPKGQWSFWPSGCSEPSKKAQLLYKQLCHTKELWFAFKSKTLLLGSISSPLANDLSIPSLNALLSMLCRSGEQWGPTHSLTGHWLITTIRPTVTCDKQCWKAPIPI